MQPDVFRIVYSSQSLAGVFVRPAEVDQLLVLSRRNNRAVDVTGALVVNDGYFVQVLEGSFDAVQSVFERIQADARHDDIVVLQAESVPQRLFADWSMAHAEPTDPATIRNLLSRTMTDRSAAASDLAAMLSNVVHRVAA